MTYDEWEKQVPDYLKSDSLWKLGAYRLSVFVKDLSWHDLTALSKDKRTRSCVDQLARSIGSISANLSEGYSRTTGKERARFYEFSLGSARESRDWYYQGKHVLGQKVSDHRGDLLTRIIKLMLTMIPNQRRENKKLSELGLVT